MKTVVLSSERLNAILETLASDIDGSGNFTSFYEDNDFSIDISGFCEIDGYVEDDYHCGYGNGTGAYIETSRNGSFDYSAYIYNEEENDSEEVLIDENSINKINNYLNTVCN